MSSRITDKDICINGIKYAALWYGHSQLDDFLSTTIDIMRCVELPMLIEDYNSTSLKIEGSYKEQMSALGHHPNCDMLYSHTKNGIGDEVFKFPLSTFSFRFPSWTMNTYYDYLWQTFIRYCRMLRAQDTGRCNLNDSYDTFDWIVNIPIIDKEHQSQFRSDLQLNWSRWNWVDTMKIADWWKPMDYMHKLMTYDCYTYGDNAKSTQFDDYSLTKVPNYVIKDNVYYAKWQGEPRIRVVPIFDELKMTAKNYIGGAYFDTIDYDNKDSQPMVNEVIYDFQTQGYNDISAIMHKGLGYELSDTTLSNTTSIFGWKQKQDQRLWSEKIYLDGEYDGEVDYDLQGQTLSPCRTLYDNYIALAASYNTVFKQGKFDIMAVPNHRYDLSGVQQYGQTTVQFRVDIDTTVDESGTAIPLSTATFTMGRETGDTLTQIKYGDAPQTNMANSFEIKRDNFTTFTPHNIGLGYYELSSYVKLFNGRFNIIDKKTYPRIDREDFTQDQLNAINHLMTGTGTPDDVRLLIVKTTNPPRWVPEENDSGYAIQRRDYLFPGTLQDKWKYPYNGLSIQYPSKTWPIVDANIQDVDITPECWSFIKETRLVDQEISDLTFRYDANSFDYTIEESISSRLSSFFKIKQTYDYNTFQDVHDDVLSTIVERLKFDNTAEWNGKGSIINNKFDFSGLAEAPDLPPQLSTQTFKLDVEFAQEQEPIIQVEYDPNVTIKSKLTANVFSNGQRQYQLVGDTRLKVTIDGRTYNMAQLFWKDGEAGDGSVEITNKPYLKLSQMVFQTRKSAYISTQSRNLDKLNYYLTFDQSNEWRDYMNQMSEVSSNIDIWMSHMQHPLAVATFDIK